jgi:hypothetical protein
MHDPVVPAGRRTRALWHRVLKDDAWRRCTLASQEVLGHRLETVCRNCWHSGEVMTPADVLAWAEVSMEVPIIVLARMNATKESLPGQSVDIARGRNGG